jgi:hypothetical protein
MQSELKAARRPIGITIICILCMLALVAAIGRVLRLSPKVIPGWYPYYAVGAAIAGFSSIVGLWKMKRWGFFTFVGLMLANFTGMFITGWWVSRPYIAGATTIGVIGVFSCYFRRMT